MSPAPGLDPGLRILITDRRPGFERRLEGWFGQDVSPLVPVKALFVMVVTCDMGADPRYLHAGEFLQTLDDVLGRVADLLDVIERGPGPARPIEFFYVLGDEERDRVDGFLDERARRSLELARVGGRA
jgi:hypothetical protein